MPPYRHFAGCCPHGSLSSHPTGGATVGRWGPAQLPVAIMAAGQVMSGQVRSGQVRSGQDGVCVFTEMPGLGKLWAWIWVTSHCSV